MYAFSRCISEIDLDYFGQKIEAFRRYLLDHFPDVRVTPKFHYLIHYPTMVKRCGPLRDLWCMRFEAKHQYFKAVANSLGNFINIALTLATRHQMLQCYEFSNPVALSQEIILPNSGKHVAFTSMSTEVQQLVCFASSTIWSVKDVTAGGCNFVVGACVIVDFTIDHDPVFLCITHIFIPHDGHIDIVGKLLLPVAFSRKFYA